MLVPGWRQIPVCPMKFRPAKPGSLAANRVVSRRSFDGWGRRNVRKPEQPKKAGFFDFIFGGFTHNLYSKNHYLTVYIPISNGEGGLECRRMYFLCARLPVAGPAREGGGSHGCSAPWNILMARNDPRRQGKPGEGDSHGCSASWNLLMARNSPRRWGKPGGSDSHGCYTREAADHPYRLSGHIRNTRWV